jgi:hypothetical protein
MAEAFEQDIFISYAHDDDLPLMEGDKGWVSEFHQTLEALVRQISGDDIHIWRDPKLQGNDFFADTLEEALPRTAVLVSIVSPRYLKSEWCLRELTCFYNGAQTSGGLRVADKSRIFKVVKTHIPREQQPTPLGELLGYEFFRIDPSSGKPVEFRKELGPEAQQNYIAKLYDTAYEITDLLGKLRAEACQEQSTPLTTVYLAETTSDLRDERDRIKTELRQQGYTVLPDEPLPLNGSGFRDAVTAYLERSALSIHLVGARPGMVPEDERRSAVRLQNDVAARFSAEQGLRRIIWIKSDAEANEEGRGKLIKVLEVNAEAQQGADLLKSGVEELKNVISDRLRQIQLEEEQKSASNDKASNGPAADDSDHEPLTAYLICDQCDFDATQVLTDYLYDQGFDLMFPAFEGDESEIREDHVDKLASCDASIFYCGQSTDLWLSSKLRDLRKLAGYREGKSRPVNAVCMASPEAPWKQRFRNRDTLVINLDDNFDPQQVAPLVEAVKASRSEANP